ncbi:aminotransferase class I/II-fold pyridoxal phosphate-dependent enzyme [Paenibacillus albidus]|uniref:aminotransferase class I/II-fold pyridoxal phosphate-dependent enzyme n=1 Tax=Paenibacillus albidus TaxID=2041023 RepID=UPI001BEBFCD2|nr:aminotransferase class I/II-fold pyridoxal phosphate-dependent enzyme [Paenibacillus albidus]MBT2288628.1 aminotransferase class I/II-fold pyridoxal phosphate-dependent enzyme [Paenibacillus albidus]
MITNKTQQSGAGSNSMSSYLAPLVQQIQPSGIRKFFDLAAGSKDIISLGVGEPDFKTPWHVREACVYSLERGFTGYTSNAGMPELREGIAKYLQTRFAVEYNPENQIIATVGGSEAIDLALRALIAPGDEILIPEPCYISYSPITAIGGGIPVGIETFGENNFKLTAEGLEAKITPRSKILILCYPSNPTGAIMSREDWEPIAKVVEKHDLIVISDEIYAELTYGSNHVSFASLPGMFDRTILVSGFSKAFAMTGWRMGYACGHSDLISAMLKIHQYTVMCAPSMGQVAALEALTNGMEEKDRMVDSYNQRRRLIVKGLRDAGLECHEPQGAFYAFPSIRHTGLSSDEFAQRLLREYKVAAVPGSVFGLGGEGYLRCSYATSVAQLNEAVERIGVFVRQLEQERTE